jgi:NADPH-dependent 2,4-dienoyl-CoA reductase/sulfur reductase-like enzyme
VGNALRALHESKGVRFTLGHTVARFEGDAAGVTAVVLDNGQRIPCVRPSAARSLC